jgi:hypothetical protein
MSGAMLSSYHHFRDACHILGPWRVAKLVPQWFVRPKFLVLLRVLAEIRPTITCDESMRWSLITADDISCLVSLNPALTEPEIRRRLAEGQECELAFVEGAPAYYIWRATTPVYLPYLGRTYLTSSGEIFVMECFTHPAFRRHGIHNQSMNRTIARGQELGLRRQTSHVAWWNSPVLRASDKSCAKVVGSVGYWNLGFHRRYFATGMVLLRDNYVTLGPVKE